MTEFLPVSSDGHLALAQQLMGLSLEGRLPFVVTLHLGTLIAVVVFYWRDLAGMFAGLGRRDGAGTDARRLFGLLLLGTVPAAIFGLLVADHLEGWAGSKLGLGLGWLFTAVLLVWADRRRGQRRLQATGWRQALQVGAAQALGVLPSVSRSGATLWGALLSGLDESWAPKYAFLLSVPAILGATVLEARKLAEASTATGEWPVYLCGLVAAAVVGYLSIRVVLGAVRRARLKYFAAWCTAVGIAVIAWDLVTH